MANVFPISRPAAARTAVDLDRDQSAIDAAVDTRRNTPFGRRPGRIVTAEHPSDVRAPPGG
jgi:hypothetical protein